MLGPESSEFLGHEELGSCGNIKSCQIGDLFGTLSNYSSVEDMIIRSIWPHGFLQLCFFFRTFSEQYGSMSSHFLHEFIIAVFKDYDIVFCGA